MKNYATSKAILAFQKGWVRPNETFNHSLTYYLGIIKVVKEQFFKLHNLDIFITKTIALPAAAAGEKVNGKKAGLSSTTL